jgi:hypothetical protein
VRALQVIDQPHRPFAAKDYSVDSLCTMDRPKTERERMTNKSNGAVCQLLSTQKTLSFINIPYGYLLAMANI